MTSFRQDVTHAIRLYRRTPTGSAIIVVVLAIGLAFVAAFVSLYSDMALKPQQGFEAGGRIVTLSRPTGISLDLIERMSTESSSLEHVAGALARDFIVDGDPAAVLAELVTRDFFPGLRPRLALGRGFSEADHSFESEPVVVISWQYWQERYDGSSDVLNKFLRIEQTGEGATSETSAQTGKSTSNEFRIVGVAARDFTGGWIKASLWLPLERALPVAIPSLYTATPQSRMKVMNFIKLPTGARIAKGISNSAALSELTSRFADDANGTLSAGRFELIDRLVVSVTKQREALRQLTLFLSASILLAVVASANASLFLLARAPARRRELGIRMAVGAPTKRLARQLASEAAVLVIPAAVLGVALSIWLAKLIKGMPFLRTAQWRNVTLLDWRVLSLMVAFVFLITVMVSLAPILGLKRAGISASSRQVAARASWAQRLAGTAQIAIAGTLAGAAIAFTWHLGSILLADPGYRMDNVYVANYTYNLKSFRLQVHNGMPVAAGPVESARQREAFAAIPGMEAVSIADGGPSLDKLGNEVLAQDPFDPRNTLHVRTLLVDSHFIDVLGLKLLHGRNLTENEDAVLVNRTFALRFFGRENVVGETLPNLSGPGTEMRVPGGKQGLSIAGVLRDVAFDNSLNDVNPMIFTSAGTPLSGVVIAKSRLPASSLQGPVTEVMRQLQLESAGNILPLRSARAAKLAPDRARGYLTVLTASLVVLLAALGFYGTQSYLVATGRREYAIRAAMGATPNSLAGLVLRRGLILGLPGLVLGLPLAFSLVAWLRGAYVSRQISPVFVTVIVAAGIVVVLLGAGLGPAKWARRTQPSILLRED